MLLSGAVSALWYNLRDLVFGMSQNLHLLSHIEVGTIYCSNVMKIHCTQYQNIPCDVNTQNTNCMSSNKMSKKSIPQ